MSVFGGSLTGFGDKGMRLPLMQVLRQAWADPDLRSKMLFVLAMWGVFVLGTVIPVPIPGLSADEVFEKLKNLPFFQLMDTFGGGAVRRVSLFALGLNPYITASIIIQILTTALPEWKKEMQEGGEYARRTQNKRTRGLTVFLCVFQGLGLLKLMGSALPAMTPLQQAMVIIFWTAGAMFMLWLGEQISERGIGNGVSLMIFAGIIISLPNQVTQIRQGLLDGNIAIWQVLILAAMFLVTTWVVVLFTTAQRRIPIQHMRRNVGTKVVGGQSSYLPLSIAMAGVIPIIFAVSLIYIPHQFSMLFPPGSTANTVLNNIGDFVNPGSPVLWKALIGAGFYTILIFFFTYFYTAIMYNVEDISNNLKRGGSFIPGVRPGKQTKDFLDGVISRITVVGAGFLALVALSQYITPRIAQLPQGAYNLIGGTSLLIMVSVALDTMRQIEANILMKQYGQ